MKSYKDELRHYGIKGQKHGKRRFQNEDGSLTAAGRARYGVSKGDNRHGILSVSDRALKEIGRGMTRNISQNMRSVEANVGSRGKDYVNKHNAEAMKEITKNGGQNDMVKSSKSGKILAAYGRDGKSVYVAPGYKEAGDHNLVKAGGYRRGANDPRAQAVAAQRANAGVRTSAHNPREMSSKTMTKEERMKRSHNQNRRPGEWTSVNREVVDGLDVISTRRVRNDGSEVQEARYIQREGRYEHSPYSSPKVIHRSSKIEEFDRNGKRIRKANIENAPGGFSGEKHEVVKASKGGQSVKSTSKPTVSGSNNVTTWDSNNKITTWSNKKTSGVAAVGKTASKQLSSVMEKARSMVAKEAVKKGAAAKKKKKRDGVS